jgi:hypothetical protein
MGVLLIRCPHTGRSISTGIEVDAGSFFNLPDALSHLKCPECGLDHAWWTREAWLEGHAEAASSDKKQHNEREHVEMLRPRWRTLKEWWRSRRSR